MKTLLCLLCLAFIALLQGCCANCVGTNRIDCDKTLQCDIQRLLAIDEFSVEYVRNSYYCAPQRMDRTLQAQAASKVIPADKFSTSRPVASEPLYKELTVPGWNSGRGGGSDAGSSAGAGESASDGPAKQ